MYTCSVTNTLPINDSSSTSPDLVFIDPDTPEVASKIYRNHDNKLLSLIMSDEFNQEDRSFKKGYFYFSLSKLTVILYIVL